MGWVVVEWIYVSVSRWVNRWVDRQTDGWVDVKSWKYKM